MTLYRAGTIKRVRRTQGRIDQLDSQIIDGRNRYRACVETGAVCQFREYQNAEADLVTFVVALNLHRRHLSESQRAMVASKIANLDEGRPKETSQICPVPQAKAASMLNVSVGSVKSAKAVQTHGTPGLVSAVERGDMAVSTAAVIASLPVEEQESLARSHERNLEDGQKTSSVNLPSKPVTQAQAAYRNFGTLSGHCRKDAHLRHMAELMGRGAI